MLASCPVSDLKVAHTRLEFTHSSYILQNNTLVRYSYAQPTKEEARFGRNTVEYYNYTLVSLFFFKYVEASCFPCFQSGGEIPDFITSSSSDCYPTTITTTTTASKDIL